MVQTCDLCAVGDTPGRDPAVAEAMRAVTELDALYDAAWFRALAEPRRFGVLSCLLKCGRACSVSEIAACCDVDFSVTARHLATLESAGCVSKEKRGRSVWYRARRAEIGAWARAFADAVSGERDPSGAACAAGEPGGAGGAGVCGTGCGSDAGAIPAERNA